VRLVRALVFVSGGVARGAGCLEPLERCSVFREATEEGPALAPLLAGRAVAAFRFCSGRLVLADLPAPLLAFPLVFVGRVAEGRRAARTRACTSSSLRIDRHPDSPWRFASSASSFQLCVLSEAAVIKGR
jgi:hypothetical protein